MESFRFSPIKNTSGLFSAITYIHTACHRLCMQSMGRYLPVAGNIGVFAHFEDEYAFLTQLRGEMTDASDKVYGKYFRLHEPIRIPAIGDIPGTLYTFLYIRKPDSNKPQTGDVDFYLEPERYAELKQSLSEGKIIPGARILNRTDLDLIELYNTDTDAFGYIGNKKWQ